MVSRKRSQRLDKLAQLYDSEILPVWAERFGRMLLRDLPIPEKGQMLDVACGTGYPAVEIIRRMGPGARLIAIDPISVMLDEARKKVEAMGARGVFFRTESAEPKLSFADGVYDLVVCNLGLPDFEHPAAALADFARVTRPSGHVRCTLPLAGSFQEFYDIYREVLTKHDKHQTLENLEHHLETYATPERCESWLKAANLVDGGIEVEEFTMLFRSSREFFFAPVIEYGPLSAWKALAGRGQEMQDVFWYIKEAIDAYFEGRAFEVTVKAGCLFGNVAEDGAGDLDDDDPDDDDPDGGPTLKVPTVIQLPVPAAIVPELPVPELPVPELPMPELPVPEPPVPEPPVPEPPVPEPPVPEPPVPEPPVPEPPVPEPEPPALASISALPSVRHSFQDHDEVTSPGGPQGNVSRTARPTDVDSPRAAQPTDDDDDDDGIPIHLEDDDDDVVTDSPNDDSLEELETLDRGQPIARDPTTMSAKLGDAEPVPDISLDAFDPEASRPLHLEDSFDSSVDSTGDFAGDSDDQSSDNQDNSE